MNDTPIKSLEKLIECLNAPRKDGVRVLHLYNMFQDMIRKTGRRFDELNGAYDALVECVRGVPETRKETFRYSLSLDQVEVMSYYDQLRLVLSRVTDRFTVRCITPGTLEHVLSQPDVPYAVTLNFTTGWFEDADYPKIFRSVVERGIEIRVTLANLDSGRNLDLLGEQLGKSRLKHLTLVGCALNEREVDAVLAPCAPTLESFAIENVLRYTQLHVMKHLEVMRPTLSSLSIVSEFNPRSSPYGEVNPCPSGPFPKLERLLLKSLGKYDVDHAWVSGLAQLWCTGAMLDLRLCRTTNSNKVLEQIASCLAKTPKLNVLHLDECIDLTKLVSGNEMSPGMHETIIQLVNELGTAIGTLERLKTFRFRKNKMERWIIEFVKRALSKGRTLTFLDISYSTKVTTERGARSFWFRDCDFWDALLDMFTNKTSACVKNVILALSPTLPNLHLRAWPANYRQMFYSSSGKIQSINYSLQGAFPEYVLRAAALKTSLLRGGKMQDDVQPKVLEKFIDENEKKYVDDFVNAPQR